jgi:hypothetical protein
MTSISPVTARALLPASEIVLEVHIRRNGLLVWKPTGDTLRGAWRRSEIYAQEASDEISLVPDIPGQHIVLDCQRGVGKTLDPLNRPEKQDLLDKIQRASKKAVKGGLFTPEPDRVHQLDRDGVKTWAWWARAALDSNHARLVSGTLPEPAEIESWPGRIEIAQAGTFPNRQRWREIPPGWAKPA